MKKPAVAVLLASVVSVVLSGCGQPSPGIAIEWGRNAAAPSPSQGPVAVAPASPRPTPDTAGVVSGLWSNLNSNTAEVARGEYAIISELEHALELQIAKLLPRS